MFSNVSNTRNIVFPTRQDKIVFKYYSAHINNTLRFVRANVSQKMFPSLLTLGNMTKHRQETMFPQQCFLVCPGLKKNILYTFQLLLTWLLRRHEFSQQVLDMASGA